MVQREVLYCASSLRLRTAPRWSSPLSQARYAVIAGGLVLFLMSAFHPKRTLASLDRGPLFEGLAL